MGTVEDPPTHTNSWGEDPVTLGETFLPCGSSRMNPCHPIGPRECGQVTEKAWRGKLMLCQEFCGSWVSLVRLSNTDPILGSLVFFGGS